jgi:hypothetical protein
LWLARKGIQNKTPANPAFSLGIVADLTIVWYDHTRFNDYWFSCSKASTIEHFITT